MNKENMLKLKNELKELAIECRKLKAMMKDGMRNHTKTYQYELSSMRDEIRHKHVAYCLARGTDYSRIEPKVREGNEIRMYVVEGYIESYGLLLEKEEATA